MNPLDRFTLSSDYDGFGVDLECDECPRFTVSVSSLALSEVIKIAEKHNKEQHGKDVE